MADLPQKDSLSGAARACHTTPRLDTLVKVVGSSKVLADIGCDHAYLPILLVRSGNAQKVIASDTAAGPINKARLNIYRFGLQDRIELRCGDGLKTLRPGEADTIVIAGLGGRTIAKILSDGADVAAKSDRLILQPMTDDTELRRYLYQNGFSITHEHLVKEKNRFYNIIVAVYEPTRIYSDFDCYVSPALLKSGSNMLLEYLEKKRHQLENILSSLTRSSRTDELSRHYQDLLTKLLKAIDAAEEK